jgi:prepilin-type N-terminal cleavage/methylation domain-containing protein
MKTFPKKSARAGFTLPELLTTIAILGILSGISIASYTGLQTSAREGVARDTVAILNRALLHFNQTNWDIVLNAVPNSTADELEVLRTLQWRDPVSNKATPGSPYIPGGFPDITSNSNEDFRIQWNGHVFELLGPGTAGSGLKVAPAAAESATQHSFAVNYQPLGPGQHE